jgi:hypothetical protein
MLCWLAIFWLATKIWCGQGAFEVIGVDSVIYAAIATPVARVALPDQGHQLRISEQFM